MIRGIYIETVNTLVHFITKENICYNLNHVQVQTKLKQAENLLFPKPFRFWICG
jgi:hypothetical protein